VEFDVNTVNVMTFALEKPDFDQFTCGKPQTRVVKFLIEPGRQLLNSRILLNSRNLARAVPAPHPQRAARRKRGKFKMTGGDDIFRRTQSDNSEQSINSLYNMAVQFRKAGMLADAEAKFRQALLRNKRHVRRPPSILASFEASLQETKTLLALAGTLSRRAWRLAERKGRRRRRQKTAARGKWPNCFSGTIPRLHAQVLD